MSSTNSSTCSEPSKESASPAEEEPLDDEMNMFRSPWKNSDVILVVGSTEFHVHRLILSMQSPVFERMLNGPFKEASQDRIKLEGKSAADMLEFLMRLYPANLIDPMRFNIFWESDFLAILPIADEYQADNLVIECLRKLRATISSENVFKIVPYAKKYDSLTYDRCSDVIKEHVSTAALKQQLLEAESTLEDDLAKTVLLEKCDFLELAVQSAHRIIMQFFEEALSHHSSQDTGSMAYTVRRCGHIVKLQSFNAARRCSNCLEVYKKKFTTVMGSEYNYTTPTRWHLSRTTNAKTPFDLLRLLEIADSMKESMGISMAN